MIDAKDDLENGMFRRKVTADGKYEIAIHPVLFGFRIRAGVVGDAGPTLDYCCVTDVQLIQMTYNCVMAVMNEREVSGEYMFADFPITRDKYYREPDCRIKLIMLATKGDVTGKIDVTEQELQSYREKAFASVGLPTNIFSSDSPSH
jgi:hypothetical protein